MTVGLSDLVDPVDLIAQWSVRDDDLEFVSGSHRGTRLGLLLLVKFFEVNARFPGERGEIPDEAVAFVARQAGLDPASFDSYDWEGRTIKRHRNQVRLLLGFRECSATDAEELTEWLTQHVAGGERSVERVAAALIGRCRSERIELPAPGRIERIARAALARADSRATEIVVARLEQNVSTALELLIAEDPGDGAEGEVSLLAWLKSSPGNVSLDTMLVEIAKLRRIRDVGLPNGLFEPVPSALVREWRRAAGVDSPSHLRRRSVERRRVLLAALVHHRERELTDTLVDLLIATVHRINARADRKVTKELTEAFKRVTGKENLLFSIAAAAVDEPDEAVRDVIFPAVRGGEATLRELVAEYKSKGPVYAHTVRTTLRASYTNHYRRGLIELLDVLKFDSNNSVHRPVIDALDVVRDFKDSKVTFFPAGVDVPVHRGVVGNWSALVFNDDKPERRVVRSVYEICTFEALRDRLRCKEIWVHGADRWRNPDDDLPADFDQRRVEHYLALRQPLDPTEFIDSLRTDMETELSALNDSIDDLDWVDIADRGKQGAIRLRPIDAAPEPQRLRRLKAEVAQRWGTVPMIDMLKEAVLRSGCLDNVASVGSRDGLDPEVLIERLLLVI